MKTEAQRVADRAEAKRVVAQAFAEGIRRSFQPDLGEKPLSQCIEQALEEHKALGYRLEAILSRERTDEKPEPNNTRKRENAQGEEKNGKIHE